MNYKTALGCIFAFLGAAFLLTVALKLADSRGLLPDLPPDRQPEPAAAEPDLSGRENMAFIQGCEFVKRSLRAPGAADFPWLDFKARYKGDGVYFVLSYVDAQNAFGGEVRETWKATVRYKGGEPGDIRNWELLSLVVGNRRAAP